MTVKAKKKKATKKARVKRESIYQDVFEQIKGLKPKETVCVKIAKGLTPREAMNRVGMAVRRGPTKPRKGYRWAFFTTASNEIAITLKKL